MIRVGLVVAALMTLVAGWLLRWQVVETHTGDRPAAIFMVNRWTGEVVYVQSTGAVVVPKE